MKKNLLVISGVGLIFGVLLITPSFAGLLKQNTIVANNVSMQPITNDASTLTITCDEGGVVTPSGTPATSNSQLKACTCYTSTASVKVGSVKININGTDRWLRTYDSPN